MALVVVSGQPCSGKSRASAELKQLVELKGLKVIVVDEPGLQLPRNESYKDSVNEKITRGRLKSTTERQINRNTIVILDSLNNIKGFRYELWCIARAAAARYCVLQCSVPKDAARAWNAARPTQQAYSEAVFRDLWSRYEEPDSWNRWDKPLFRVNGLEPEEAGSVLQAIVESVTGSGSPQQGMAVAKQLQPTMATSNPVLSTTNLLHELDVAAQDVIGSVAAAQERAGSSAAGRVDLGHGVEPLFLHRHVNQAELRRHKRVFLKVATQNPGARVSSQAARKMFASFLQEQLQ